MPPVAFAASSWILSTAGHRPLEQPLTSNETSPLHSTQERGSQEFRGSRQQQTHGELSPCNTKCNKSTRILSLSSHPPPTRNVGPCTRLMPMSPRSQTNMHLMDGPSRTTTITFSI